MKRIPLSALAIHGSLLMILTACQPPAVNPPSSPSPTPQTTPTPIPSNQASPSPSPPSQPSPSIAPSSEPTPTPTPEPTPTPTPEPTPTPSPVAEGKIRVQVFNEDSNIIESAQVSAKSLTEGVQFQTNARKEGSFFYLETLPLNATLEVKVTAPGYTTRTRLISVTRLEPSVNIEFKGTTAISNKPEVLSVIPAGSLTSHKQALEITFSEGMNRESVEHSLALQLDSTTPALFLSGATAPAAQSVRGSENDVVYDIRHFEVAWNTDQVLRLTPRFGWPQTTNSRYRLILSYRRSGDNLGGGIKDQDGVPARTAELSTVSVENGTTTREDGPFRNGNLYRSYFPLSINSTANALEVTGLSAINDIADSLTVTFSGDMTFQLPNGTQVVGGGGGQATSAPAGTSTVNATSVPANYRLSCNGSAINWPAGTTAIFLNANQVKIQAPIDQNVFNATDSCQLEINGVQDPSGQLVRASGLSIQIP